MNKFIHPITEEAALYVASNLLPDDYKEVAEGHGHDPMEAITACTLIGDTVYFTAPNNEIAGIAGVQEDGKIWMLCTPVILKYPHTFAKQAKIFVESRNEKLLWNIVDKRNRVHIKLLRFLGFKFLRELKHGPNQLSFMEFCRGNISRTRSG